MPLHSILIVEDSAADRALYRHTLTRRTDDYRLIEAASVGSALEKLEAETPECILLDYLLPDGTGLDLIDALLEHGQGLPCPVVMVTGEGNEAVAVRAMKAGVTDYAIKGSANSDTLLRVVENALEKGGLQRELARRAGELEQLAYVVSHDLRAPLRTVHQNAELLKRGAGPHLNKEARSQLERIQTCTRRMESLITELVGYCRIGGAPALVAVDLNALIEQVLSDLEAQVVESGAEIEVGALPTVKGDAVRLRQLFQNLISNALKFCSDEEPHVVVDAEPEGENFRVSISDNGLGIDSANFERIFQVFKRLPGSEDIPGTGIGLATCKKIVEQHGSSIDVRSEVGVGTCFSFVFEKAETVEKDEA